MRLFFGVLFTVLQASFVIGQTISTFDADIHSVKLMMQNKEYQSATDELKRILKTTTNPKEQAICHLKIGACQNKEKEFEIGIEHFNIGLSLLSDIDDSQLKFKLKYNKANAQIQVGSLFFEGIEGYKEILKNTNGLSSRYISRVYLNLGIAYLTNEREVEALRNFEQARNNLDRNKEYAHLNALIDFHIGSAYLELGRYLDAIAIGDQVITYCQENENEQLISQLTNANNGIAYIGIENYEKGIPLLKESIESGYLNGDKLLQVKRQLAIYYDWKNDFKKSESLFKEIIETFDSGHYKLGQAHTEFASMYLNKKSYGKALVQINRATTVFNDNIVKGEYLTPIYFLKHLEVKADILLAIFQSNRNEDYLFQADSILTDAWKYLDHLQINNVELHPEKRLIHFKHFFTKIIDLKYQLYKLTKQAKYKEEIFSLVERSKNFHFRLSKDFKKITKVSGIPNSLIKQEIFLNKRISELSALVSRQKGLGENYDLAAKELYEKRLLFNDLRVSFERKYPKYYNLKYEISPIGLNLVQQELIEGNQSIVDYYLTPKFIYILVINNEDFDLVKIDISIDFEQRIIQFRQSILDFGEGKIERVAALNDYIWFGNSLYKKVIEPISYLLKKKIVIIPDKGLSILPFDALLTTEDSNPSINGLSYLLRDYQISYSYSIKLLTHTESDLNYEKSIICFAPKFQSKVLKNPKFVQNEFRQLENLPYVALEIDNIKEYFQLELREGEAATEQNFSKDSKGFQIIHCASHSNSEQGYLAFTQISDSLENELLYVHEIYNMELECELVTMSSCSSSFGDVKQGEGLFSLTRAFLFAGAQSVLGTLWQIQDKATAKLMKYYYRNLSQEKGKSEALRAAKLAYIDESSNVEAHPYYWSSFILVGNDSKISLMGSKMSDNTIWNWLLGVILILGTIFFKYFLNKK